MPVIDPRTGEPFTQAAQAGRADTLRAIGAADRAFLPWARRNVFERTALMREAAGRVLGQREAIAKAMTLEQGKPFAEALGEVDKGAEILRYYAEEGERVHGRLIENAVSGIQSFVIYQPLGVAAAICPWNYPVELLAWKLGAALAAGCSMVCKFSSETPLSPAMFVKAVQEAGFPPGVINTLNGKGAEIGGVLLASDRVKKVAFTGSTATGKGVLAASAQTLKKTSMELGGSLPMLIFADCDLDAAAKGAARRSFRNMGQICIAVNRIYVQKPVYGEFLNRFKEETEKLVTGDGFDPRTNLGPMCTAKGLETVKRHVEDALAKGARLVSGGFIPQIPGFPKGYWYAPAILAGVSPSALIMTEETFGPAVGVASFESPDEAIVQANSTEYGLAAIVYSSNIHTIKRCALEIDAGNVAVNNVDPGVINAPYGGWKSSGFGREHGSEGLFEYLQSKHVRIKA
jgi:succinate-semialdehyde dehydrogenase/glutarate-semialdehyde dehydrogenase